MLAFADPEIVRMATHEFVAVAADDWYQRRRQDEVGKFWLSIADQGRPRNDGGTRQGIYCFTADGKLLASKNAGQNPAVMRDVLKDALAAFQRLPAEQRKPGAVTVPEAPPADATFERTLPKGGVIIKVYTRILDRNEQGQFCKGTCNTRGGDQAARDHLWLTEAEWKSLIPDKPMLFDRMAVPDAIAERIVRFHLHDNTRGEPPMWQRREVRSRTMNLTVTEVTAGKVAMKLEGNILLATGEDPEKASRGFDARLLGFITCDTERKSLTRFDLVAVGDHWGRGQHTRNARPGRTPLGIAFELARGDSPGDRIPPQAAREINSYFATGR